MARWLIQTNDRQFSATGLAELQEHARNGRFQAGDLIQPPGASEWMYALEIPQLKEALDAAAALEEELGPIGGAGSQASTVVVGIGLLAIVVGGAYYLTQVAQDLPDPTARIVDQISYSEVVVTEAGTRLLQAPEPGAAVVGEVPEGSALQLLAKRGAMYRVRDDRRALEGWLPTDAVLPMYRIGGKEIVEEYDPLYNPDRYLEVMNASWMQLPDQRNSSLTVFQFMLRNPSRYDMTDVRMVATIKDEKGHELEKVEFAIEGVVPAESHTMVGTFDDPGAASGSRLMTQASFRELSEADPELRMRYSDGVEVEMQSTSFQEASIDIAELRAVPRVKGAGAG